MHLMMLCEQPAHHVMCGPSRLADVTDLGCPSSTKDLLLVEPGREYAVSGMVLIQGQLWMLVYGEAHRVGLAPVSCFAWQRWQVPSMWHFALVRDLPAVSLAGHECAIDALWGYRELVDDRAHLPALLSGHEDTFRVFSRRTSQR